MTYAIVGFLQEGKAEEAFRSGELNLIFHCHPEKAFPDENREADPRDL